MKTITWNGWTFVAGKCYFWKERHNPDFKNNREKVIINANEYNDTCRKWAKVFR